MPNHDPDLVLELAKIAYDEYTFNAAGTNFDDLPTQYVRQWQRVINGVLDRLESIRPSLNSDQMVITLNGPDTLWFSSGKELTRLDSEISLNGMEERDRVVLKALCEYIAELLDNR